MPNPTLGGTTPRVPHAHPAVERAYAYLAAHLGERVTLARLSEVTGVSRWHLARLFADHVGEPPRAHHARLRLAHARALLEDGVPVSAAAYRAGFADQSHLTRLFKQAYGITPGDFQRRAARAVPERRIA